MLFGLLKMQYLRSFFFFSFWLWCSRLHIVQVVLQVECGPAQHSDHCTCCRHMWPPKGEAERLRGEVVTITAGWLLASRGMLEPIRVRIDSLVRLSGHISRQTASNLYGDIFRRLIAWDWLRPDQPKQLEGQA